MSRIGFVGGGRVTRIFLAGWRRAMELPDSIVVSDPAMETLCELAADFPLVGLAPNDNRKAAEQEVVFLAVPLTAMLPVLAELRGALEPGSLVVSLAPKLTLARLGEELGGHRLLARVMPSAPSIVGAGFNPMSLAAGLPADRRAQLASLLAPLGESPEVEEAKLEAYQVTVAMGPTYLWFQLEMLREIGRDLGLTDEDLTVALAHMANGAARTLFESGLAPEEVMDLIPVKPLAEDEAAIRAAYRSRLPAMFAKLRP